MRKARCFGLTLLALLLSGCLQKMFEQPYYRPLARSHFFDDGTSARPMVPGTVPRGRVPAADPTFYDGLDANGKPVAQLPVRLTMALLERGEQRYDIDCSPCHGYAGDADGMIVKRGFPQPPSFHSADLAHDPIGSYVQTIADGHGVMFPYAVRVKPADRWAIAAYIRALQFSRRVPVGLLTPAERATLRATP